MSSSSKVTITDIEEKVTQLEKALKPEDVDYIIRRWLQGRALEVPLAKVENLLVRFREVKAYVGEVVDKITACLESPYGGCRNFFN